MTVTKCMKFLRKKEIWFFSLAHAITASTVMCARLWGNLEQSCAGCLWECSLACSC